MPPAAQGSTLDTWEEWSKLELGALFRPEIRCAGKQALQPCGPLSSKKISVKDLSGEVLCIVTINFGSKWEV